MTDWDRLGTAGFFVACLFLAFIGGAYVILARVFPYRYFDDAYKAFNAVAEQHSIIDRYTQTDQWRPARTNQRGVTIDDPRRAYNGYTLYTSAGGSYAVLINMRGEEVHRWSLEYSSLWQNTPDGRNAQPDSLIYWTKAVLYPNGDLVATYIAAGDTPWGYGLIKLDADSNVIWTYHGATNHDIDILPDGRILAISNAFSNKRFPGFSTLAMPHLEDFLVVLDDETGKPLRKISLLDAYYNSRYRPLLLAVPSWFLEDPLHTNSVQYIGPALADTFAPAHHHANQVLISFRNPGTIGLLDLDSGTLTWMSSGYWLGQHSARALADGDLALFDNYGHFQPGNASRVLEIDPTNYQITWRYDGTRAHPLWSRIRSEVDQLPNGNRLVTESDGGRLLELAPDGTIVWEFINPARGGDHDQYMPVISSGERIKPDTLDPAFRRELAMP